MTISKPEGTKKYRLVFGSVDEACTVWFNGKLMLNRPYPYQGDLNSWQTAFEIDITSKVRFDRPNILAVRVENNSGAGGIFKPVYLIESDLPVKKTDNPVQNSGFEKGQAAWSQHAGCGTLEFSIDDKEFYGGKASARITCTKALDQPHPKFHYTAWGRWYQPSIPVKAGGGLSISDAGKDFGRFQRRDPCLAGGQFGNDGKREFFPPRGFGGS